MLWCEESFPLQPANFNTKISTTMEQARKNRKKLESLVQLNFSCIQMQEGERIVSNKQLPNVQTTLNKRVCLRSFTFSTPIFFQKSSILLILRSVSMVIWCSCPRTVRVSIDRNISYISFYFLTQVLFLHFLEKHFSSLFLTKRNGRSTVEYQQLQLKTDVSVYSRFMNSSQNMCKIKSASYRSLVPYCYTGAHQCDAVP